MRKLFIIVAFVILPHTVFAGDWVLWECTFVSNTKTDPPEPAISVPLPLTEHKTLKACQDASAQVADTLFSWAKKNDSVRTESVVRATDPDGVLYTTKSGFDMQYEYRCYPYGVVPTKGYFFWDLR